MEFDDTGDASDPDGRLRQDEARSSEADASQEMRTQSEDDLGADLEAAFEGEGERGLETRRQKALIAAALFDEPVMPVKIGRFTIVRELGAGGMGVVYVAYDEQLDRRLAVKLLRGAEPSSVAQARLEREAQAMARLSHPNVVTVHDVGKFEGQVFVAMEFVEGQDLRAWLRAGEARRGWREILDKFVQAGEGLAAAHDKGIVHRDFKPDNVLVGEDGRVKVADFGLAHAFEHGDEDERGESPAVTESQSGRLGTSLTRTGAIMGTPAYMAPEQYLGERTDARSDQFSFCVALWEGLYGRRPFVGDNLAALSASITEGRLRPPPDDAAIPPWLGAVVTRGLATAPDARWPSMRELLDTISRDPGARRRKTLLGLGISVAGLGLIAGLTWLTAAKIRDDASQRYWNGFTAQLLEIERERGLAQANDDARRARDATRMSVYRSYRPKQGVVDHEDPMIAAALLREVEGETRRSSEWISAANEILGRPISYAVLEGHREPISALAFSPEGDWLYSASFDGEVWRWRVETGEGERIYAHDKHVHNLALSPDGRQLVSSSDDGTARAWSVDEPGRSRVLVRHEGPVMHVAFDPSGEQIVSASKDGTARIHELASGRETALEGHAGPVYAAVFDAAGERILTGSGDHSARLWRVRDGVELARLDGHEAAVFHVRMLADGRALTASDDGSARVHALGSEGSVSSELLAQHDTPITALDVNGDRVLVAAVNGTLSVSSLMPPYTRVELPKDGDAVWSALFSPSGDAVISARFDGSARLVSADGRGVPRVYVGHRVALFRATITRDGRWLATGSYDGSVRLWRLGSPRLDIPLIGHDGKVFSVALDTNAERVATTAYDGIARVWDVSDGTLLATLDSGGRGMVGRSTFSPDGRQLAAGRQDGAVVVWDIAEGERIELEGHREQVWSVAFDASGEQLATASLDNTARIWDIEGGESLLELVGHEDTVVAADFDPDRPLLVTASHDGTLRRWDRHTGKELAVLRGHDAGISDLARSPDGELLATGSKDATVRLWRAEGATEEFVLAAHEKEVWSVEFDADGTRLVSGSFDGRACVWDVSTGVLLHTLTGHADEIWGASFAGQDRIVTVSNDNTVRVWSLSTDEPSLVLSGHEAGVTDLVVTPDGLRAVSSSNDHMARIWALDQLRAEPSALGQQLWSTTRFCLPIETRMRELGERRPEAELASDRCLRRRAR